jgi:hypothetical protein
MLRQLITIAVLALLVSSTAVHADDATTAARERGFKPVWTGIGAGAGFGLGVWAGLAKFDDAINSDRKVWTTAIVSAAVGGVLGFLVDRRQARSRNPSLIAPAIVTSPADWRQQVYGSPSAAVTLRPPSVAAVTGVTSR